MNAYLEKPLLLRRASYYTKLPQYKSGEVNVNSFRLGKFSL